MIHSIYCGYTWFRYLSTDLHWTKETFGHINGRKYVYWCYFNFLQAWLMQLHQKKNSSLRAALILTIHLSNNQISLTGVKMEIFSRYVFFQKDQGWDSQNLLSQILKIFVNSKWIWKPMTQIKYVFQVLYCRYQQPLIVFAKS
jgi:hypothetical protein